MIGWVPVFLVFVAEVEEQLVGSGAWPVGWSIIGVTNCIDFAGISCLRLSPSCTGCRRGRVAKWWFVITPVVFSNLMDDWRPFLASGKCYVLWKKMYAISLYRYDVCIYSGSREQIEIFVRETSRFLTLYFSPQFLPSRRELSWSFLRLQQFWESGRVFCSWGWVSSCLFSGRWLRSWSWDCCWPVTIVTVFL